MQIYLHDLNGWRTRWSIGIKDLHISLLQLEGGVCPEVTLGAPIPRANKVKYLGVTLDKRLTYGPHITETVKKCKYKLKKLDWMLRSDSPLSLRSKRHIYNAIVAPVFTYAMPLWGSAARTHINKVQTTQNKALRTWTGAEWYVRNETLHTDLEMPTIAELIGRHSTRYADRISAHPNQLAANLATNTINRRLKRSHPLDLRAT